MTADIKWGYHVTARGRAGVAMDVEPSRVFVRFEDMSGAWFDRCAVVAGWPLTPAEEGEKAAREEAAIAAKTERAAVLLAKAMIDEQVELLIVPSPGFDDRRHIEEIVQAAAIEASGRWPFELHDPRTIVKTAETPSLVSQANWHERRDVAEPTFARRCTCPIAHASPASAS